MQQDIQELNLGHNAPQLNRLPPVAPIDVNLNYQNEAAPLNDNHAGQVHQQIENGEPRQAQILIRTASYEQCTNGHYVMFLFLH